MDKYNPLGLPTDEFNPLPPRLLTPEQKGYAASSRREHRFKISNIDREEYDCYPFYFVPRNSDVIVGKGVSCFNHIGNKNLRKIAAARLVEYTSKVCKVDRSKVVSSILEQTHKNGGAFIKKDEKTGLWYNAENQLARDKISVAFRNLLKQSSGQHNSNNISNFHSKKTEIMSNSNNRNVGFDALLPNGHNVTLDFHRKKTERKSNTNNRNVAFNAILPYDHDNTSNLHRKKTGIMSKNNNRNVEFAANSLLELRYVNNATSNFHGKKTESKRITSNNNHRNVEFNALLPAISKWFKDRGFPYTMHIDRWLCDAGVTSIEHLKLVTPEEWETQLLCQDELSKKQPNCRPYLPITLRSFQAAIEELKKVKYDVMHAVPINTMHAVPIDNDDSYNQNGNHCLVSGNKRRDDEETSDSDFRAWTSANESLKKEIHCLNSKVDCLNNDLLCDKQALSNLLHKLVKQEKELRELKEEISSCRDM